LASQKTNDAQGRARLILTATPSSTGVTWEVTVEDANTSYGGYSGSQGSWTVKVNGKTVLTASSKSYDFGSNVITNPYFPRGPISGFESLAPGPYTATATFSGDGTTVGTANVSVSFTVVGSNTVSFNSDGGSVSPSPLSGASITLPSPGTKPNYSFSGWYTPSGSYVGTSGTSYTTTGTFTLTAYWSYVPPPPPSGGPTYYSYSYESNGGSSTPSGSGSIASGTAITLGSPGTKTGFTFAGWYLDSGLTSYAGNIGSSYAITADRVFYAKWSTSTSILPAWPNPVLALAPFIAGQPYSDTITVANMSAYNGVYSISSGSLPGGISINSATGALTGTVTTGTDYSFTVLATNSSGTASQAYSGTITGILRIRQGEGWVKTVAKKREGEIWKPGTVRVWSNGTWLYGS
jgi:uncharacterized repeat protein (TIGR02543 family)